MVVTTEDYSITCKNISRVDGIEKKIESVRIISNLKL
jgi:hypothetical protein